jgi:hypothetical protein
MNVLEHRLTLLFRIREVPGSNLSRDAGYLNFVSCGVTLLALLCLSPAGFLLDLFFDTEEGDDMLLRNVG